MGSVLGIGKGQSADTEKAQEILGDFLMVRFAIAADKMACIRLLRESHEAAGFIFQFKAAYATALFDGHMSHDHACVLVLEHEGQAQGLLMASWFEHPFGAAFQYWSV